MANENLWAPWRMAYIRQLEKSGDAGSGGKPEGCFLCEAAAVTSGSDEARQRLVLSSDERGVLMLNKFPYTNGHLLVSVVDHVGSLTDLSAQQRNNLMELTAVGEQLLRTAINAQGMNIGINLGRCAGAGLPGHLHVHLVPRWSGDTNFMGTVGQVRVIPDAIEESYAHLSETLSKVNK